MYKRRIIVAISFVLFLLLFAFYVLKGTLPETVLSPKAYEGQIDLTRTNFTEQSVSLRGEWEFYWQNLLGPEDFQLGHPLRTGLIPTPRSWVGYKVDGQPLPAHGYATFRLQAKIPIDGRMKALSIHDITSSYKLWVNGELIGSNGTVGTNKYMQAIRPPRNVGASRNINGIKESSEGSAAECERANFIK